MSSGDIEKIFLLLKQFYPKHPFWESRESRYAYRLALEPFSYDEIKQAVLAHVRRTSSFPFVAELTAGAAPPKPPADEEEQCRALYGMTQHERMERMIALLQSK